MTLPKSNNIAYNRYKATVLQRQQEKLKAQQEELTKQQEELISQEALVKASAENQGQEAAATAPRQVEN
jgi:hypothetical protein